MTPDALARLHSRCFASPPPWSARAFADALATRNTFLLCAPGAFALGRVVAGEAELLTLAVAPEARRRGVARNLCSRFGEAARTTGADAAFLEVAADNAAARALYLGCGWIEAGRRPRYYGPALDAVIMRLDLAAAAARVTDFH